MLGTEERSELQILRLVQELDGAFALAAAAGVVGNEADLTAGKLTKAVALQDVDTRQNVCLRRP